MPPGAQFNAVTARLFLTNESVRLALFCRTRESRAQPHGVRETREAAPHQQRLQYAR
jgi:hypothetical protein